MAGIEVIGLYRAPIKSCALESLHEVKITPRGFAYDRHFMLVDENDRFISQREHPEMARIQAKIDKDTMAVTIPEIGSFVVPLLIEPNDDKIVKARVQKRTEIGQHIDDEYDEAFTEFLGESARLLVKRTDKPTSLPEVYLREDAADHTGFADLMPITLASYSSLNDHNRANDAARKPHRSMFDFRPNIAVFGSEGYAEDRWRKIRVGSMVAYVSRPCGRCVVIENNKTTGVPEPGALKVLAAQRLGLDMTDGETRAAFFMQQLQHVFIPGMKVEMLNQVTVLEAAEEPNWAPIEKKAKA